MIAPWVTAAMVAWLEGAIDRDDPADAEGVKLLATLRTEGVVRCSDCGDPAKPGRSLCARCDNEMEREQELLDRSREER